MSKNSVHGRLSALKIWIEQLHREVKIEKDKRDKKAIRKQ